MKPRHELAIVEEEVAQARLPQRRDEGRALDAHVEHQHHSLPARRGPVSTTAGKALAAFRTVVAARRLMDRI